MRVARGAAAVLARDARLFWSYRFRAVAPAIGALFTLALFRELANLISTRRFASPAAYFEFAVIGLALLPVLRFAFVMAPTALRDELIAGTFEQFALSAFGPVRYLLCTLAFPCVIGLVNGLITIVFAAAVFGLHVAWGTAVLALPLALLIGLAVAPFGALLLAATMLVKQVSSGAGWLVAAVSLLGGAYFPVALLPHWIRWASDAQPLTPALALARHVLVGTPIDHPALEELARVAVFAAAGLPLAAVVLHRAYGLARRRGTLLEY